MRKVVFGFCFVFAICALIPITSLVAQGTETSSPIKSFKVEVSGRGPAMILIPGLGSSGDVWKSTVAHYSGLYQCHVLTLAGFAGQPPLPSMLLSTQFLGRVRDDLARYIRENKLEKPVIVGHSLGGLLALELAAEHPEIPGRLIIVDSVPAFGAVENPTISPEELRDSAANMRDRMNAMPEDAFTHTQHSRIATMATDPKDVETIYAWGKASDRTTMTEAMYELLSTDLRDDVARITSPTLVLGTWIAQSKNMEQADVRQSFIAQYQKLKGVRIEIAPTARHFIMFDDPQWMFSQMDAFLPPAKAPAPPKKAN
jgi:pimeloyl-ACP methyl ester carboxylesterase